MDLYDLGKRVTTCPMRELAEDEAEAYITLMTIESDTGKAQEVKAYMEANQFPVIHLLTKTIAVFTPELSYTPCLLSMLGMFVDKPYHVQLYIAACANHARQHRLLNLTMGDFAAMFPEGVPTEESLALLYAELVPQPTRH